MQKMLYLGLFIVLWITIYVWGNYCWKGWYENKAGNTLNFQIQEKNITISSNFWLINSALKVTYIDSFIDEDTKEIYTWIYSKYYSLDLSFYTWKDKIKVKTPWDYKIYYKNPDKSCANRSICRPENNLKWMNEIKINILLTKGK